MHKVQALPASAISQEETPMDARVMQKPLQAKPAAALPPRKPKLQPGDFYITLPKLLAAVPNLPKEEPASQQGEHAGPETVFVGPQAATETSSLPVRMIVP